MTMRGVIDVQHGSNIAFCGEVLGEELSVHYSGFVRFISYDAKAALELNAIADEMRRSAKSGNNGLLPGTVIRLCPSSRDLYDHSCHANTE